MFAPRRTTAARRGAPLLAGLAVGAVLIGTAAVVTPDDSAAPALNAALGAPLTPTATGPAPVPPPAPPAASGRPQLTVPAPVTTPPPTPAPEPEPVEPVEATERAEDEADEDDDSPTTTPAPPSSARPDRDDAPDRRARVASGPADGVVEATNAEREEAGCDDLRVDLRLAAAAQGHAEDMAENGYFSHTSQDGREFDQRIRDEGHPSPGGENIAAGQETAEEVVAAWMDSPGHRRNILDCSFTAIGVGYDPDGDHWVQNFGR